MECDEEIQRLSGEVTARFGVDRAAGLKAMLAIDNMGQWRPRRC